MNVLVVGGAGFLGSHLVRRCLAERDHAVTVLDSLEPRLHATTDHLRPVWDRIRFVHGSMCDESVIAAAVRDQDVIFHCAGQTSHVHSIHFPVWDAEINCIGTLRLLEAVRQVSPGAVVVYASSSTVIGKSVGEIVDEHHLERPLDIYSANKGVAEKYHFIYHRVHDLHTVVLRFPNLYGPFGKGYPEFGFANYFIHLARTGVPIPIFGSGEQLRNVLYVEDAAEIMYRAVGCPALVGEPYFAVHDEHLTVAEIAREIDAVFGGGGVVNVEWPAERKRFEVDRVQLSGARLREVTGWRPRLSFRDGLARTRRVLEDPAY